MPARAKKHSCLVPGCPHPGHNQLGIRCRIAHSGASLFGKRRTDAVFSVESSGFLCDRHALAGGRMLLMFEPDGSKQATLVAASGENTSGERTKPIQQAVDLAA